ncbi:MAG: FAD:protein FMN transferase, partial [Oscillibacter sp.]|nr:FAD:protein FMN transferase [Oscillibacter sp.]
GLHYRENRIPTEAELSALLESVDYRKITLDGNTVSLPAGMEIDLGGVAKGYAGAKAAEYLRQQGVTSAMLSLGGNVQTVGAKPSDGRSPSGSPWRVAVQDPASDGFAGVVEIIDKAAVTSGGYQRFFVGEDGETYWHIMDPATGRPAKNGLVSVTIVAEDGALCDALSTALFVMGPERAVSFWRDHGSAFGMVLITEDGRLLVTPDLSFTADPSAPYRVEVLEG